MKISLIFFSLLSGLSVSMLVFLPTIPRKAIGQNFFRFIIFLNLLCLLPFLPFNPYSGLHLPFQSPDELQSNLHHIEIAYWFYLLYGISLLSLLSLFYTRKEKPIPNTFYIFPIVLGLCGHLLDSLLYLPHRGEIMWENIFVPLLFFSSSAALGSALFAMLLGHWYLVQFDLDKKLLRQVALFYCLALAARTFFIVLGFALYWKTEAFGAAVFHSMISLEGHGIFFWMRVGPGLLLPIILAYMIYETAKMGANQACTGLLYIAVLFVFMGEMVSRYLFFMKGLPL